MTDPRPPLTETHGVAIQGDYGVTCACGSVLNWPRGWSRTETAAERLVWTHAGECLSCNRPWPAAARAALATPPAAACSCGTSHTGGYWDGSGRHHLAKPGPTMTDRDALRARIAALPWNPAQIDAPNIGEYEWAVGEYRDTVLAEIDRALAQPAEPGHSDGCAGNCGTNDSDNPPCPRQDHDRAASQGAHPLTEAEQAWERGYDRGYTVGQLTAAAQPAEPGLTDDHYPDCDRNPCRCAGVTTKPGLDVERLAWSDRAALLHLAQRRHEHTDGCDGCLGVQDAIARAYREDSE